MFKEDEIVYDTIWEKYVKIVFLPSLFRNTYTVSWKNDDTIWYGDSYPENLIPADNQLFHEQLEKLTNEH